MGRHRIPNWFKEASGQGKLLREGHTVEESTPVPRDAAPWTAAISADEHSTEDDRRTGHAWTDGSFRKSAGLEWVVIQDDLGAGLIISQSSQTFPGMQAAFDAEITAIEEVLNGTTGRTALSVTWSFTQTPPARSLEPVTPVPGQTNARLKASAPSFQLLNGRGGHQRFNE
jgi:hypothetical protein